jgi:uncharacterized membrane protein YphA (DoxX/SURF4 family)
MRSERGRRRGFGATKGAVDALVFALRLVIGVLLLVAGALKVGHAPDLAAAIAGFRLLPAVVVGPLALALPYFELMLGLYLVLGLFTRVVATIACAQFLAYGAVVASAVLRHIPADCGCFGPGDVAAADWPHAGFDLLLALGGAVIAYGAPGALAIDRRLRTR